MVVVVGEEVEVMVGGASDAGGRERRRGGKVGWREGEREGG